jgi:uncharacterized membrane protein YhaH (DUF805 family)
MTVTTRRPFALERLLAALLEYGTWAASILLATGIVLNVCENQELLTISGTRAGVAFVSVGVAIFILLPILRLTLMLGMYLRQRDYRFSLVVALVLLIVGIGCFAGVRLGPLAG